MIPNWKIYPRSQGHSTVYLRNVVNDPAITLVAQAMEQNLPMVSRSWLS